MANHKHYILIVILILGTCAPPIAAQIKPADSSTHSQNTTRPTSPIRKEADKVASDAPPQPRTLEHRKIREYWVEFRKKGGVVYRKTDDYQIKCDVYIPEGEGPFPAILAVHGGAWRQGSKFTMLRHAWRMAGAGYVVVAINYRHAPNFRFPAQVHDCKDAVRWMRANATDFKIDPDRIGAFGYSAGGHLIAMLGTSDQNDDLEGDIEPGMENFSSRVGAVAVGGAPCDFSWIDDDSRVLSYWLGGSRNQKPDVYQAASPASYITADDPPFFFFHGESDLIVPIDSSLKFHQRLLKSNIQSQHWTAPRGGHLGTFSDMDWMDRCIEFFDSALK